jgi:hypothetical protein
VKRDERRLAAALCRDVCGTKSSGAPAACGARMRRRWQGVVRTG